MTMFLLAIIAAALIFGGSAVKSAIVVLVGLALGAIALAIVSYSLGIDPFITLTGLAAIAAVPLWFLDRDRKKEIELNKRYEETMRQLSPEIRKRIEDAKRDRNSD